MVQSHWDNQNELFKYLLSDNLHLSTPLRERKCLVITHMKFEKCHLVITTLRRLPITKFAKCYNKRLVSAEHSQIQIRFYLGKKKSLKNPRILSADHKSLNQLLFFVRFMAFSCQLFRWTVPLKYCKTDNCG
jgi:hypothetical protein